MGARQKDDEFSGQPLPGTGGDFVDGNDVEGHRVPGLRPQDVARRDAEEVSRRWPGAEDDVEGHLYRNLPTTQGEIVRRGPGDHPHGER